MTEIWRFKDEWLIRALSGLKEVLEPFIARMRAEKRLYLSHAVIDAGLLTAEQLGKVVELTLKVKYLPLAPEKADKFGLNLLHEKICRKYGIVPVQVSEDEIRLAMDNPLNLDAQSDVEAITARRVIPFFSLPLEIDSCLEQLFNSDKIIFDLLDKVESPDEIQVLGGGGSASEDYMAVSAPVVLLANSIISQAHRKSSSDIHIEHGEKASNVRIRIDGVLKNIMTIPRPIAAGPLVSRIKIMADLDVSNHLRPQDGRAKLRIGGAEVGLRVSTLPTSYGEKVVIRILDQRTAEVPFKKLGFAPEVTGALDTCLRASQGMILVTGPTGSGKTTTLYSMLNKVRHEGTNIVTVEDPIEYKLAGINQVQVNERQGLTFSSVLRSVLRQDPDIIMVGEVRDRETADIAFQAAMTGHLVFSTLHTNDTVSTISRLADMGVDRFKISPSLLAITSQRLVRKLCPVCAERVPERELDKTLLLAMSDFGFEPAVYRGRGCSSCENNGYAGRTSLVEILQLTPHLRDIITTGMRAAEITRAALEEGALRTITQDALWHLSKGHTDLAEIAPYLALQKKTKAHGHPQTAGAPRHAGPERRKAPAQPALLPPVTEPAKHPAVQPERRAAPHKAPAHHPAAGSARPRVMVAEDNDLLRMLLKKFLQDAGFEAILAEDGAEALELISSGKHPDLLVSDINMPRMNGFELIRGVRETLGIRGLPVVILTSINTDKSQELAFRLGADDYIHKPFSAPVFIARIRAALRRAGRSR